MSESSRDARILVVDDEADVADVYELRLRDRFETETAYGGEAALDAVDDDVDVVLLDRRMPRVSGDEVLETIRERDYDCRVVLITAIDPDFDIVDMPFDDYLCKPVQTEELVAAIERQLSATHYDDRLTEFLEVTSKLALLEAQKHESELAASDDVADLRERAAALRSDLDEALDDLDGFEMAFRDLARDGGSGE